MAKSTVDLEAIYRFCWKKARAVHPELPAAPVGLKIDQAARTTERSFAFFRYPGLDKRLRVTRDASKCHVALSPDLMRDKSRAYGVIAHEVGHAVDHFVDKDDLRVRLMDVWRPDGKGTVHQTGLPMSAERLADLIAEDFLGREIFYGAPEIGYVQTIKLSEGCVRPRPKHLG